MDFTLKIYQMFLKTLKTQGFLFLTFEESFRNKEIKSIILRHDVDLLPENSLDFARIEAEMGIRGTYYFRLVPRSFNDKIIKEISSLGHEIGYHYEDMGTMARRHKGIKEEEELVKISIDSFAENLESLRKITPVNTICMHGSPMSRWDSKLLWKYYDYHDFGITGEPYFDVNFDEVLYLTDTGRRWDGDSFNLRDKAQGSGLRAQDGKGDGLRAVKTNTQYVSGPQQTIVPLNHRTVVPSTRFHSTFDIIRAAEKDLLPDKIMMTFHPQRWTDKPVPWVKELVWQNVKNIGKYFIIRLKTFSAFSLPPST
jgi:hypothetical protein